MARLTIEAWQASMLRGMLDRFACEGIAYTDSSHWLLWTRFHITGPQDAIDYIAVLVNEHQWHVWGEWKTLQGEFDLLQNLRDKRA